MADYKQQPVSTQPQVCVFISFLNGQSRHVICIFCRAPLLCRQAATGTSTIAPLVLMGSVIGASVYSTASPGVASVRRIERQTLNHFFFHMLT